MRKITLMVITVLMSIASPKTIAMQADPDISLEDPALEQRAIKITNNLRCPTCVSQSVGSSNVGISQDLQRLVRERIMAGDSDQEIYEYVAERYGDFVLLRPRVNGQNAALWILPGLLLVGVSGGLIWWSRKKQQSTASGTAPLNNEEEEALNEILGGDN